MKKRPYIIALLSCLIAIFASAQTIEFVENKGQWDSRVLYAAKLSSGVFYIHRNGFTVLQHNADDIAQLHQITHDKTYNTSASGKTGGFTLRSHAYTVNFEDANAKAAIIADKPLPTVNNFFIGDDKSKWAANCQVYQGITVKDVYPNIDVRYYSGGGTLKYDLIVKPGGRTSDILLNYDGVDNLSIKKGELAIATSVGELRELSPFTYQNNDKGRVEVPNKFKVNGKKVSFDLKPYNPKSTLVIDPTLIFCALSGSTADNWGFTATYGPDGAMYGGGIVFGQGFPVTPGAFQTAYASGSGGCFGAGFDIGIIKLSSDGSTRVYATYIGGSGNEMPQSLICTPQGQLVIAGRSNSPATGPGSYPTTTPMIGTGGGWDITITKLNAAGNGLIGSMRIGGNGDDGANITACGGGATSLQQNYGDESRSEVNLDGAGNIYLASCTQSTNFPTQNAFQTTSGGLQDGVVLKCTPNLSSVFFSTYFGGSGNDATYVLSLRPSTNEIYVAGGTESANLPGNKTGTIGPNKQNGIDGFVAVINNNGSAVTRTTYLGTSGIDQVFGIQFDKFSFPYVMGQTTGTWPIQNALWNQPGGRQFISKLQPDLSAYVYSTTFGKGGTIPDLSPVAFLVDRCQNVYVSGWGGKVSDGYNSAGVQGLPVTPDADKSTPDINSTNGLGQDFYFFVLERDAKSQLYGSFFGQNAPGSTGDHVDGGTSRFDESGTIYQAICANCGNTFPYPTTPGAMVTTKPTSANCNLAMVKIAFNFSGVASGIQSSINGVPRDTAGCVPLTVDFSDTLLQAVSYEWDFGDGSPRVFTNVPNAPHTYTSVGIFRVMLIAIDSTTCNIRDTSYTNIKVGDLEATVDFTPVKIDTCTLFRYRFDNNSVAPPSLPFKPNSFVWDFGDGTPRVITGGGPVIHQYATPGTYTVKLFLQDSGYCNAPDSMVKQIRVAQLVTANFITPTTGCAPYDAFFENVSSGGSQFLWDFGDGSTSTEISPTHTYAAGVFTVRLTAIDSATCNIIDDTAFTITIQNKPVAAFTAAPQPPTVNTPISFTNQSSADAIRFKWFFGDGDSLLTNSRLVIQHEYNTIDTFNVCLIAINASGCPDTVCQQVRTLIEVALDVPNAFTPLSSDGNNKIFARGFGIAKMKFTIWNRWGEKVFETNNKNIGWDGRFNGKLLPMDVYAYTLEAEFFDKTKAVKKGDITLIR